MTKHTVDCTFEINIQPAKKVSLDKIEDIVANELDVDKIEITSIEVEHDIPKVEQDGYIAVLFEDGTTTINGTYETTSFVNI